MLDWIFGGVAAMWVAWNYWSVVPVVVFIVLSILLYKRITSPVGAMQQQNYKENQKTISINTPKMRKYITMGFYCIVLAMGGILFAIGLFKMG